MNDMQQMKTGICNREVLKWCKIMLQLWKDESDQLIRIS